MTPPTDIVIGVHLTHEFPQAWDYFQQCMGTLGRFTQNFRPIVVDDHSDVSLREGIAAEVSRFPCGILIRTHMQKWFTRAFNIGLRQVRTPWAVILNCDCILGEGWLDELYRIKDFLSPVGNIGLVGSVYSAAEQRDYEICNHPGYVTGHCWLLNMQAAAEVAKERGTPLDYLDETNPQMIHIRSDVEMCYKLMQLRWLCVSSFKSGVGHVAGQTWGHRLGSIPSTLEAVNDRY